MLLPFVVVVVVVVVRLLLLLLQQRLVNQQLKSSITKAIISPVVSDSFLPSSNTAYSKSKYSRLVVIFIENPLCFYKRCFFTTICAKMRERAKCKIFVEIGTSHLAGEATTISLSGKQWCYII